MAVEHTLKYLTESTPNGHRGAVRSGLLKGYQLTVPQLERLAYFRGNYEPHIIECLQSNIQQNNIVFDVGANCGYLSMIISRLVSPDGKVIAFEPVQSNANSILQNISDNGISNINLVQKAIGDKVGIVKFATYNNSSLIGHIAADYAADDAITISVESTTLDTCVYEDGLPAPHVIKIDVEGGEGPVLFGATRLLKEHRPIIIAEVWDDTDDFAPLISYMQKFDYDYQLLDGGFDMNADGVGDVIFFPK